ncbi:DUF1841 family protein [Denitratisoma oestradiolicum]|uniref:DUF1841 domain-containing protein n=1 Tax=Denitratisoma oestradiolicum TaxID=311182 RepID=A0A6S6XS92_9PROT|nr:DUF1841 family protein [Denitratisoma oestradiolicum]CAB1368851.1 conserved protein of unknown function [Denitratisoma oestradiolicum]
MSLFNPSRDQARQFLMEAWRKRIEQLPATPLEIMAADVVQLHPEYHALLAGGEEALARDWTPDQGDTNPFLHLSLHLAIEEQLQIDQPPGIRAAYEQLLVRRDDPHEALHAILDCLAEAVWRSQRDHAPMDGLAYLEALKQAAGR